MTFTIRVRGDSSAPIVADYRCATCGVFAETVPRSDVPDELECPDCGELAPWTISAPLYKPKLASVTTGKQEKPPHPGYMDTRQLGEGMPMNQWRKERAKYHEKKRQERRKRYLQ